MINFASCVIEEISKFDGKSFKDGKIDIEIDLIAVFFLEQFEKISKLNQFVPIYDPALFQDGPFMRVRSGYSGIPYKGITLYKTEQNSLNDSINPVFIRDMKQWVIDYMADLSSGWERADEKDVSKAKVCLVINSSIDLNDQVDLVVKKKTKFSNGIYRLMKAIIKINKINAYVTGSSSAGYILGTEENVEMVLKALKDQSTE